jgi:hypothetical protein
MMAEEHEYRYARLAAGFGIEVRGRITSYVYPSPDAKGALTGSRTTSVVPVWLPSPQVHILFSNLDGSLGHELVHVFSREFGLPVVNASLNVGLVEGLAVAMEPPDGRPRADEQISAALLAGGEDSRARLAERVVESLGLFGFWGGRGAVSYSVSGSFISYLIEEYGVQRIMAAYPAGHFDDATGKPLPDLVEEWLDRITDRRYVDRNARQLGRVRFARPSLFERECPHHVPEYYRLYRRAQRHWENDEHKGAREDCEVALRENPDFVPALALISRLDLADAMADSVLGRAAANPDLWLLPTLTLREADARALTGDARTADSLYLRVDAALPTYATEVRSIIALRRLVADRPEVLQTVLGFPSLERSRDLASMTNSGAAVTLGVQGLAEEGEWGEACQLAGSVGDVFTRAAGPAAASVLRLQRMNWQGLYCETAGRLEQAAGAYARAHARAMAMGATNLAEQAEDRYARVRWKLLYQTERRTLTVSSVFGTFPVRSL